jgi:hypothetical protein
MNIFHEEHLEILKTLLNHKVKFLLVGGVAVNFYGYSRPTGDLDVWLEPTSENRDILVSALADLDIIEDDLKMIKSADFSVPMAFHIGNTPPFIIDFLTKIVGVKWPEAWEMKTIAEVDGLEIPFIHVNHLKQNKMITGRPKDLDDLAKLLRIEELRQNKK